MNVPDHITKAIILFIGLQFNILFYIATFRKQYIIMLICYLVGVWMLSYLFKEKPKFKKQYNIFNPNKERKNKGG